MANLIREAPLGRFIRLVTGNRFLKYPEEEATFVLPERYSSLLEKPVSSPASDTILTFPSTNHLIVDDEPAGSNAPTVVPEAQSPETRSLADEVADKPSEDLERGAHPDPIMPKQTPDGIILVDWYDTMDSANPKNWIAGKKACAALVVCLYTFAVYVGSAIYISSEPSVGVVFGVSEQVAALPLSLYVLACAYFYHFNFDTRD